MSSWLKRPAKRWASAAVVVGSVSAVLASPLALGTAAAAAPTVTSVSIASTTNDKAGGTATINATYSPQPTGAQTAPSIEYTVLAGPDADAAGFPGHACTVNTNGTAVCSVPNTHGAGSDTVRVFADNNGNNAWDAGEPNADTTVVFSSGVSHITLNSPGASSATNTCAAYTAHVTDAANAPAAGQTVVLTVTETATSTPSANAITLYNGACSTVVDTGGTVSGNTITYTHNFTVGSDGNIAFGLASSEPGTATVKVADTGGSVSDQSTVAFSAGGSNNVAHVTVTSATTVTNYTGTTATYTVKATDAAGNPIQGVTVNKETTSGPDNVTPTPCGTTNASGTVTCSITNGGNAGTDQLVFWVDNNAPGAHTSGPDPNEPQTTATAVFNAQPTVSAANSTVTCVQQLSGANQGKAQGTCTVPTSQHAVTITAVVKDTNGNPIPGVTVTFTTTSATFNGTAVTGANLPSGTATTNASGVATFQLTNASAANGDTATVKAAVGATTIGNATVNWVAPKATQLTVTPTDKTVTKGGTVTLKAQVTDQFGNPVSGTPNITYTVAGRNNGKSGTAAADGTITYQDTAVNPAANTDTVTVVDNTDAFTAQATIHYVTGPATASTVTVDTSGKGTTDATCGATGNTAATNVAFGTATTVCAIVKNANGETLAGDTVTFTVNNGQVAAVGALPSSSAGTTFQTTTDANGVAFADVTSTTTGPQTVTATADSVSGTGTVTYAGPAVAQAYSIALSPAAPTVAPGASQKFTATVTDKFGNTVPGVTVGFTQQGPGSLSGASSASVVTGTDGTASVTLTTLASDSGTGSVTASITSAGTQCNSALTATPPSSCTATSTYTVGVTAGVADKLVLTAEHGAKTRTHETVVAFATAADGTPVENQVVRFFVAGANKVTGAATTDATGHAKFIYLARHHGEDSIAAYVDTNNDQIRQASEPRDTTTTHILGREHPHISLRSNNGKVKITVQTHPVAEHALVRYYVKRHGAWKFIGNSHTNAVGGDHHAFRFHPGSHHKFRVSVKATIDTTKGTSKAKSIRVRG